jgi:N-acetyltransferase
MTGMEFRHPVVLDGRWVALVPVSLEHVPLLAKAGRDPAIWTYVRHGAHHTPELMRTYVETALAGARAGTDLPFTIFLKKEGAPVGMTRFLDIRREDRGVEIGGTWLDPRIWRTPVNTEAKYLLLRYAFEKEGCLRVQLKTDLRNVRSQRAIERLGATKEGVFRKHLVLPDGHVRDSVFYSIVDDDWPRVKARLEGFLQEGWSGPGTGGDAGPE